MTRDGAAGESRGGARPAGGRPVDALRWGLGAAGVAGFIALAGAFAAWGGPHDVVAALATMVYFAGIAGGPAAAYIGGAWGLGRLATPLFRGASQPLTLQLAVGIALMLTLSHAMGCCGLLAGETGRIAGTGVCAAGLILLAHQFLGLSRSGALARVALPPTALLAAPGVALLFAASCNPPGWLWESEFGGYDALSYHLQLPQEWIAAGRVAPARHNVYSFLPSYVESAFVHLGALMGAPARTPAGGGAIGLLAGEGAGVIAAQMLHAGLTLCAGALAARAALRAMLAAGLHEPSARAGAGLAFALFMLTPWTIVVGSLAYNEMGLMALFAGAMLAGMETEIGPARRGALVGMLVGVACGCKPTALLFAGVPTAILMLGVAPRRQWPTLIGAGAAAGVCALAPWLIRNWLACGNPVFPYAAGLFGTAHWTAEQTARYKAAHSFDGSLLDRFRLLVAPDAADPAGSRHRGMFHPQWSIVFPVIAASAAAGAAIPTTRRLAALFGAGLLAQVAAWLFATHLQSRFLLPLLTPGVMLFAMAAAVLLAAARRAGSGASPTRGRLAAVALSALTLLPGVWSVLIFTRQRGGEPNSQLLPGPGAFSGEAFRAAIQGADPASRRRYLDSAAPPAFANLALAPTAGLLLVGDATPLYFTGRVMYATTWDRSPLVDAIGAAPDNPAAWTASLRRAGVDAALVNFGELDRLQRSKTLDPSLSVARVAEWVRSAGPVVRQWDGAGELLVALDHPPEADH